MLRDRLYTISITLNTLGRVGEKLTVGQNDVHNRAETFDQRDVDAYSHCMAHVWFFYGDADHGGCDCYDYGETCFAIPLANRTSP
jgi:hypothetical protein